MSESILKKFPCLTDDDFICDFVMRELVASPIFRPPRHLSMHTLFRSVTGGVDWGDMANLLIYVNWIWGHLKLCVVKMY